MQQCEKVYSVSVISHYRAQYGFWTNQTARILLWIVYIVFFLQILMMKKREDRRYFRQPRNQNRNTSKNIKIEE